MCKQNVWKTLVLVSRYTHVAPASAGARHSHRIFRQNGTMQVLFREACERQALGFICVRKLYLSVHLLKQTHFDNYASTKQRVGFYKMQSTPPIFWGSAPKKLRANTTTAPPSRKYYRVNNLGMNNTSGPPCCKPLGAL